MEELLSWARIILSVMFLTYASWSDFKTREVSNNVWLFFAPSAFLLTLAQFLFFPPARAGGDILQALVYYGISFAVTSAFSISLFYVGAFGGADAKALMCIALALPIPPDLIEPLSGFVSFVFSITVFSNGVIIAVLSVFYTLFRNLMWRIRTHGEFFQGYENASFGRKALTLLCGYRISIEDLKKSFSYPLEDFQMTETGETQRKLLLFPKDEDREEIVGRIAKARSEEKIQDTVWATPGLPMLIFITIGLLLAFTVGDIVWIVVSRLL